VTSFHHTPAAPQDQCRLACESCSAKKKSQIPAQEGLESAWARFLQTRRIWEFTRGKFASGDFQSEKQLDKTMIDVDAIVELQTQTVARWHQMPVDNAYDGMLSTICQQHSFNYLLWHEEDIARSRDVSDAEIARVKRSIDGYNQNRNDWIEKVDDEITALVKSSAVNVTENASMNTETPGCTIDRLSILALRIYHLREQLERDDVEQSHLDSVNHKIAVCLLQQNDLKTSLQQLLTDIFAGRKKHRTYRQFKMYNDPTLNPFLYQAQAIAGASTE
jgi:hypothetical protein